MNIQRITLDVSKRPAAAPVVRLRQGDENGTQIAVHVTDNGADADLDGLDATLLARLADGGLYLVEGEISGSTATFAIDETDLPAGNAELAYVELSGEDIVCSTQGFSLIVEGRTE